MSRRYTQWAMPVLVLVVAFLNACGGGSGSSSSTFVEVSAPPVISGNNVLPIAVQSGPGNFFNVMYTTVTVCVAGTSTCQVVDHVQVDTGSTGLRIQAAVLPAGFAQQMAAVTAGGGNPLGECTQFLDGFSWGPVKYADAQIGGETASHMPIQIIGDGSFSGVPDACKSQGVNEDTPATFGANGIIGVASPLQDCGSYCVGTASNSFYYACNTGTTTNPCQEVANPLTTQVQNPIAFFTGDNNGSVIMLPGIPSSGASVVHGYLVFGIGTNSSGNNALGNANIVTTTTRDVAGANYFSTNFQSANYGKSYVDSGTSDYVVPNGNAQIATCMVSGISFLCPSSPQRFNATFLGQNSLSVATQFSLQNAQTLLSQGALYGFNDVGEPAPSNSSSFAWGAPFFYGHSVFIALEGVTVSGASAQGPFVAF